MTDNHPITPTLKLFRKWTEYRGNECEDQFWWRIATQAARWGADQELDACYQEVQKVYGVGSWLRSLRRPKPPSLKQQALALLDKAEDPSWDINDFSIIRKALEQLDD
jgi:hypothetical protein